MVVGLKRLITMFIGVLLAGASTTVWALKPLNITAAEMAMLPRFCADTQTFAAVDSPEAAQTTRKWVGMMGSGFYHVHHYCWARINYNRAMSPRMSKYSKTPLLQDVRGDFYYVLNNAGSNFVLAPEIWTWVGRTSVLLDDPKQLGEAFAKAIAAKPDYWPPYYYWAEFLRTKGKKAEALQMIRSGLKYSPAAKPLLLLYRDLGGNPADIPPPIAKPDEATEPSADQPAEGSPAPDGNSQQ